MRIASDAPWSQRLRFGPCVPGSDGGNATCAEAVSARGQSHGADQIRVVATSAMRDARNAAAFHAWVKAETGWNMEDLSGLEEGRLIHRGIVSGEPGTAAKSC